MTHFAFPNVEVLNADFIGCGRYLAAAEPVGNEYASCASIIINQATVDRAVALLAHEAALFPRQLYEKKDRRDKKYVGESMHLAYLLANLHCARRLRHAWPRDIWCTGKIAITPDQQPVLQEVGHEAEFSLKLTAFLDKTNPDTLFIAPTANLRPNHVTLCKNAHVIILSLEEFEHTPFPENCAGKMLLTVLPHELAALIHALFIPGPNPYNGLTAFDEDDANRFFGREKLIETLYQKFLRGYEHAESQGASRMLTVLGPSGSGKSSVVRAGLIPRLKQHPLPENNMPRVIIFTCGAHPLLSLANALTRLLEPEGHSPETVHRCETRLKQPNSRGEWDGLGDMIAQSPELREQAVILVADQCEEIYSLCNDDVERTAFLQNLLYAVTAEFPFISAILTLRSDFLEQTQTVPAFNNAIVNRSVLVPVMTRTNLRDAIEQPAKLAGYRFAPELVERLIAETDGNMGALPLLEFTLSLLWEGMLRGYEPEAALERVGGVGGALADRAEHIYDKLSSADKRLARAIFLNLICPAKDGLYSRRRIALDDIAAYRQTPESVQAIFRAFSEPHARLLTLAVDADGAATVEITHEALISRWRRLRKWLEVDREFHAWRERLKTSLQQWETTQHDDGALLRGRLLSEAEEWLIKREDELTSEECSYIIRSQRHFAQENARWKALYEQTQQRALEAHLLSSRALFASHDELQSLLAALKAGTLARELDAPPDMRHAVVGTLRDIVYGIRETLRLQGHRAPVRCLSFSPDGQWLVSGSYGGVIKIWEALGGYERASMHGHADIVRAICFSPDGKFAATGSDDETIKIWNAATGQEITAITGLTQGVYALAFSPDGTRLASGGASGAITIWNISDFREMARLRGHDAPVFALAFHPLTPNLLTSGSDDATIRLWNLATHATERIFSEHQQGVFCLAFHPQGHLLASGSGDASVNIWDVEHECPPRALHGHLEAVNSLSFHANGAILASASGDKTVKLWDVSEERELLTLHGHDDEILTVGFSPDGSRLVSGGWDKMLKVWDVARLLPRRAKAAGNGVNAVCFHPTRPLLASGHDDGSLSFRDALSLHELTRLRGHADAVRCVAFSPDGRVLASGGDDAAIVLWNVATGEQIALFASHADAINSVAFSPDSRLLASGSSDHLVIIWEVETGTPLFTLAGQTDAIWSVCFSPDGKHLATASWRDDHTIAVWEMAPRRIIHTILIPNWPPAKSGIRIAMHPGGTLLASGTNGNGAIMLWNMRTGQEVRTLQGHSQTILTLAFSPDGSMLASGSEDNTARLWNVADGQKIATLKEHSHDVRSVAFSPDGEWLASGSLDDTVKLWHLREQCDFDLDGLLAKGCDWIRRYLAHNPTVSKEDRRMCDSIREAFSR